MAMDNRKPKNLYPIRSERMGDSEVRISLTTVCIKTGTVRVPRRQHEVFASMPKLVFEVGGVATPIAYEPNGQLTGLREVFLQEGVNPNDFLVLSLSENSASIDIIKRERSLQLQAESVADSDSLKGDAPEQPMAIRKKRTVRIDVQQYYPLEKPLTSFLAGQSRDESLKPGAVTARKKVSQNPQQPAPVGERNEGTVAEKSKKDSDGVSGSTNQSGGEAYAISSDFERWLTQSESMENPASHAQPKGHFKGKADAEQIDIADVILRIEHFLALPDTPAIVQTSKIAHSLQLPSDLCERALERISEDHERVNRIRNGAYMIRQKRSTANVE